METRIGFVPIVNQNLKYRGKLRKENCAFLPRMSQQSQRAGQGRGEEGPELLRAGPAQVMKMQLARKMGMRPVLTAVLP